MKQNSSFSDGLLIWICDMIECFPLWIYREITWKNGEVCFRFIIMYGKRGSFYGRQLKNAKYFVQKIEEYVNAVNE